MKIRTLLFLFIFTLPNFASATCAHQLGGQGILSDETKNFWSTFDEREQISVLMRIQGFIERTTVSGEIEMYETQRNFAMVLNHLLTGTLPEPTGSSQWIVAILNELADQPKTFPAVAEDLRKLARFIP